MAKLKIVTTQMVNQTAKGDYAFEMEALEGLDAEIIETPATEAEFLAAARDADAVYSRGVALPLTKRIIDASRSARSSRSAASASTPSTWRPRPPGASPSPTAPTPSSRRSPITP